MEDFFSSKHQVNPLNTEYEQESTLNYLKVVKQVSDECFRLELSLGPVFFVHCRYLSLCNPQKFEIGYVFSEEELNELFLLLLLLLQRWKLKIIWQEQNILVIC